MILVDSSVLLDILLDDPRFAAPSETALRQARAATGLVICETVMAEIRPVFADDSELEQFCDDISLEYHACPKEAAMLAGALYAQYLSNKGRARRVVPDFLIGAHAMACGYSLLARDRGYYREYFRSIDLIEPKPR
ncbi:MAG: PIN domain-containing protein [Spirochaetaceae bacterium]|nr:MAG: PIN domain-containing protein [Spirochaetaceae bacterium]